MIPVEELQDLSHYTTERLETELVEYITGIGAIKHKILDIPRTGYDHARHKLRKAKLLHGTIHQVLMHELGCRRREKALERAAVVEKCFVDLAKERLPSDVFQDLLDEAVDMTRESS